MGRHTPFHPWKSGGSEGWAAIITAFITVGGVLLVLGLAYLTVGR